jgi:hypothetical protein
MSGLNANQNKLVRSRRKRALPTTVHLSEFVVYRDELPPIKHQENCGSCWTFAAPATMDHQYYRATKTIVSLSEEQIVGCTYPTEYNGCDGGNGEKGNKT